MHEIDSTFLSGSEPEQEEEDEEIKEINLIKDPYVKKNMKMMKNQEYRTLTLGPLDLLKNG